MLRICLASIAGSFVAAHSGSVDDGEGNLMLLQIGAKAGAYSLHDSDGEPPRMLVMDGCSGSSFIMGVAMKLMEVHGLPAAHFGDSELMKPEKNEFFTKQEGMGVAMEKANAESHKRGKTLLFQTMTKMLTNESTDPSTSWELVAPHLKKLGTYVVYARRANVLDHAVCAVRDCFEGGYGVPVDKDGHKSTLCFERRTAGVGDYKAQMIPAKLAVEMKANEDNWKVEQAVLRKTFPTFSSVTMENLLAYQYGLDQLETSTKAWADYMLSWGVKADTAKIKTFLSGNGGEYKSEPGPHSESIYNIDEVRAELKKEGLDAYLREAKVSSASIPTAATSSSPEAKVSPASIPTAATSIPAPSPSGVFKPPPVS